MEMYADEDARGGVLEPEGIVGLKYRKDKQLETMARLDPTYGDLKRQLAQSDLSRDQQAELKQKMTQREELLLPVYSQISIQYADLHDRAGRMEAKGTIRQPLRWLNARRFFYWRLRRRLNEEYILKRMASAESKELAPTNAPPTMASRMRRLEMLRAWSQVPQFDKDDTEVAQWYEENRKEINAKVEGMRRQGVEADVAGLLNKDMKSGIAGVKRVLDMMPVAEREELLKMLSKA